MLDHTLIGYFLRSLCMYNHPVDTGCKLNVYKTFRRSLMYVQFTSCVYVESLYKWRGMKKIQDKSMSVAHQISNYSITLALTIHFQNQKRKHTLHIDLKR